LGQDDRGWTCLFRAVDQGHLDIIKMLLQTSDCTCAEKLLMLRDKVRNFKPIDDQGRVWIQSLEASFPSKRLNASWNEWFRACERFLFLRAGRINVFWSGANEVGNRHDKSKSCASSAIEWGMEGGGLKKIWMINLVYRCYGLAQ